jgi:hypothetical protein
MVAQKWAPHHLAGGTYRQCRRDGAHNKQDLRTRHRVGDQVVAKMRSAFCGALRSDTIASSRRRSSGVTWTVIPALIMKLELLRTIWESPD